LSPLDPEDEKRKKLLEDITQSGEKPNGEIHNKDEGNNPVESNQKNINLDEINQK